MFPPPIRTYRIAAVLKVETDIITNISASLIGDNSNIVQNSVNQP